MSAASIEAALRLDIAELQQKLTLANAETDKWKTKVENGSRDGARSVDSLTRAYGRFSSAAQSSGRIISANTALFLQAEKAATAAARAQSGRGGRGMQIGGAAMQIQDIAVQMQMGTKASTILAQQGSQLLSFFGPKGMILGAVVAAGASIYTMRERTIESLKAMSTESERFGERLQKLASMDLAGLINRVYELKESQRQLSNELSSFNSSSSAVIGLQSYVSPVGEEQDMRIKRLAQSKMELAQAELRILELSQQELAVMQLRAEGSEKEAGEMQRKAELAQEIARIQQSGFSTSTTEQLVSDATARSEMIGYAGRMAKRAQDEATIKQLREKLAAQELAQMSPEARFNALRGQQGALFDSMDTKGGLAFEKSIAGLREWAAQLEKFDRPDTLATVLSMLDEALRLEREMAAATAEATAQIEQQARAAQEQQAAAEQKLRDQQNARNGIRQEMIYLQLTAAGRSEEVEILKEAQRIKEQAGVTDQQALNAARQMIALRQQARGLDGAAAPGAPAGSGSTAARMFTEADRQAGWLHPSVRAGRAKLMGSAGGGGLAQFDLNQRTASQWQMAQWQPSAWTQLQQRAAGNAAVARQEAASKPPADMTALFQQLIQITSKGLLGT